MIVEIAQKEVNITHVTLNNKLFARIPVDGTNAWLMGAKSVSREMNPRYTTINSLESLQEIRVPVLTAVVFDNSLKLYSFRSLILDIVMSRKNSGFFLGGMLSFLTKYDFFAFEITGSPEQRLNNLVESIGGKETFMQDPVGSAIKLGLNEEQVRDLFFGNIWPKDIWITRFWADKAYRHVGRTPGVFHEEKFTKDRSQATREVEVFEG